VTGLGQTNGRGGGEGPWRALNVEEKKRGEEKISSRGAQRLGRLDGEEKERGGPLGVGMREVGVRPGVASGTAEGGPGAASGVPPVEASGDQWSRGGGAIAVSC
jgi:hypothetical protein